jgi:hypothetical protein
MIDHVNDSCGEEMERINDRLVLRPAAAGDFAFCRRLYFEEMAWIIDTLKLDMAKQHESFSVQ